MLTLFPITTTFSSRLVFTLPYTRFSHQKKAEEKNIIRTKNKFIFNSNMKILIYIIYYIHLVYKVLESYILSYKVADVFFSSLIEMYFMYSLCESETDRMHRYNWGIKQWNKLVVVAIIEWFYYPEQIIKNIRG
jgi:hypothetical protein